MEDPILSKNSGRVGSGAKWTMALIAILFLVTRIPLLRGGFGSDDDAWRNAANALRMLEEHRYVPSRAPGFPAYDAVLLTLILIGPIATNLASIAFQAIACWAVWRIERQEFPRPGLVAAALALAAPFAVPASQTMDYALSAALLTLGCLFLIRRAPRRTGLMLALATGARASNALALPAATVHELVERVRGRTPDPRFLRDLGLAWAIGVAILFAPVLLAGTHMPQPGRLLDPVLGDHADAQTFLPHARGLISFLLGKTAALWIGLGLVALLIRRFRLPIRAGGSPAFEVACVVLAIALSFALPSTPAALLPVFPLLLLLMRRLLPTWAFAGLALSLALEIVALPLLAERRIVPGALFRERAARQEHNDRTDRLRDLPEHPTVRIVTRQDLHRLLFSRPPLRRFPAVWEPFATPGVALAEVEGTLLYADSLTATDRTRLTGRGFTIVDARGPAGPARPNPRGPGSNAARFGF